MPSATRTPADRAGRAKAESATLARPLEVQKDEAGEANEHHRPGQRLRNDAADALALQKLKVGGNGDERTAGVSQKAVTGATLTLRQVRAFIGGPNAIAAARCSTAKFKRLVERKEGAGSPNL